MSVMPGGGGIVCAKSSGALAFLPFQRCNPPDIDNEDFALGGNCPFPPLFRQNPPPQPARFDCPAEAESRSSSIHRGNEFSHEIRPRQITTKDKSAALVSPHSTPMFGSCPNAQRRF
jgi:hypothetical protein